MKIKVSRWGADGKPEIVGYYIFKNGVVTTEGDGEQGSLSRLAENGFFGKNTRTGELEQIYMKDGEDFMHAVLRAVSGSYVHADEVKE